jgi:hypothetical protein
MLMSVYHGVPSSSPHVGYCSHIDESGGHRHNPFQDASNLPRQLRRYVSCSVLKLIQFTTDNTFLHNEIPVVANTEYIYIPLGIVVDREVTFRQDDKFLPWNIVFLDRFGNQFL